MMDWNLPAKVSALEIETAALRAERDALRDALGCFIADGRFRVAVGGNPIVVEAMLRHARKVYEGEQAA